MADVKLPPLPEPDEQSIWGEGKFDTYTLETLKEYGDARAAQQPAAEAQGGGEVNPWQFAIDQARVVAHLGVAADGVSKEEAAKQLGELIHFHITIATDPAVNGGYSLQPAAVDGALELVRDIAEQKPEKPDHWNSCSQCESNIDRAQEVLAAPARR